MKFLGLAEQLCIRTPLIKLCIDKKPINQILLAVAVAAAVLNMKASNKLAETAVAVDVRIELVLEYDWKKNHIISKSSMEAIQLA